MLSKSQQMAVAIIEYGEVPQKKEVFVGGEFAKDFRLETTHEASVGAALHNAAKKVLQQREPVRGNLAKAFS